MLLVRSFKLDSVVEPPYPTGIALTMEEVESKQSITMRTRRKIVIFVRIFTNQVNDIVIAS